MSTRASAVKQSDFIANPTEAVIYTATVRVLIDKCNSSAVLAGTVTARIVESGGSSATKHQQAKHTFILDEDYQWPQIVGQVLEVGDSLLAVCTVASAVTMRVSARQLTTA